jgi:para-nitrobenzyl esterase
MSETLAETALGKFRGSEHRGIRVFKGIPYGAATDGANRFRPPRPAAPSAGVRDALAFGPSSPQMMGPMDEQTLPPRPPFMEMFGLSDPPDIHQSEDCLVLNVWTPGLADGAKRPVLFRIHGGGYGAGSGSWNWHDGTNIARRGDVVVVTVNHRLSPLGYLYLDGIGGDDWTGSGNVGMLDLVLALEWVRDNIEAFGGDPDRVMIFGESGGGSKVCNLLAMPQAAGLFHRAVEQSGPMLQAKTTEEANATAEQYLAELGVGTDQLDRLFELPMQQFLDAHMSLAMKRGSLQMAMVLLSPVVDGRVLPSHPGDAISAGAAASIPLLLGSTRHEMAAAMSQAEGGYPDLDDTQLRERLQSVVSGPLDDIVAAFRRTNPDASPTELFALIQTAATMGVHTTELAERKLAGGTAPVYAYLLTWRSPVDPRLGAPHGMCVPLSMDNCQSAKWSDVPEARPLAARMSQAWINFAACGDPNHPDLPKWEPYSIDERTTMLFGDPCTAVDDPFAQERIAMQGVTASLF